MKAHDIKNCLVTLFENPSIKLIFGCMAIFIDWLLGQHYQLLLVMFILIILDTFTGFWVAYKSHIVSSYGFFRFSAKLTVYFVMILTAALLDKELPIAMAVPVMSSFLTVTEAISIFENISKLGFPVPTKLVQRLNEFRSKELRQEKSNE